MTVDEDLAGRATARVGRLAVTDLSFRYAGSPRPAIENVTFQVSAGQVLGVLGANGSGKSTLLNALLDVRLGERRGEVLLDAKPLVRRYGVGLATQHIALYQQMTVLENLRHAAFTLLSRRLAKPAIEHAVGEYGLAPVARTPVHQLSGGWQRIVHIATSFVHRPGVRLLDEPTAALDFEARGRLVGLIDQWRRAGAVILVTSHYPEDIQELCTHAVLVRDGTVARFGTLVDLLGGRRRQLLVEAATDSGVLVEREPAPLTGMDAVAALDRIMTRSGGIATGELRTIRITDNSLREHLAADPELRGLLDEDG